MRKLNPYKIIGLHPVTNQPITLKWYRGASRYNNGATMFGNKYLIPNRYQGNQFIQLKWHMDLSISFSLFNSFNDFINCFSTASNVLNV